MPCCKGCAETGKSCKGKKMSIDTVGLLEKGVSAGAAAVLYNVTQHGETFSAASGIGMWAGATAAAASIASDILGPYLGIPRMFSEAGLSAVGWAYVGADKAGVVESTPKLMLEGAGFSIAGTLGQKWMAKTSMGGTYIKPSK